MFSILLLIGINIYYYDFKNNDYFYVNCGNYCYKRYLNKCNIHRCFCSRRSLEDLSSPEYKFSIEYPSGLEAHDYLSDKIPSVSFYNFDFMSGLKSEVSSLDIHQNNMSLQEFVDHSLVTGLGNPKISEGPTPITMADGNPGLSYTTTNSLGSMDKNVVFTHGDHNCEFTYIVSKENFNESQYNHMVESIKFMD